jgi:hypothetical protein
LLLPLPVGPIIIKAVQNELVESTTLKNEARSLFWLNAARNGTNCQIVWNIVAMIQCLACYCILEYQSIGSSAQGILLLLLLPFQIVGQFSFSSA